MTQIVSKQQRNSNRDESCLCSPGGRAPDSGPEYLTWITTETDDPANPYPVLCTGCPHFKAALGSDALASSEGDGVPPPDEPTAEFDELPKEEQVSLKSSFPAGSLTRLPTGDLVRIPEDTGTLESLRGALSVGA